MLNVRQSMREGFGRAMVELGTDSKVVALCADVKDSLKLTDFAQNHPDRYFEFGVAEQNMVATGAGMALEGLVPFACSYATFVPGRSFDQVRISVAYNNANVKLIASHAGISTGPDGATHQMLEDVAMLNALPNMTVIVPADSNEAYETTLAVAKHAGPCYIRLSRAESKAVDIERTFTIGKAQTLKDGDDVAIIANGLMVNKALSASARLRREGVGATVINCHTVRPLDKDTILKATRNVRGVVVAEEAQRTGGLGASVAQLLSQTHPKPMRFVAIGNKFGRSGEVGELMRKYNLTAEKIVEEALTIFRGGRC